MAGIPKDLAVSGIGDKRAVLHFLKEKRTYLSEALELVRDSRYS